MSIIIFIAALFGLCSIWGLSIRYALKHLTCTRAFSRRTFFTG